LPCFIVSLLPGYTTLCAWTRIDPWIDTPRRPAIRLR
jgi:hypothetical protein